MTAVIVIALVVVLGLGRRIVADAARMQLVAEAEHELRGPLQLIALAIESPSAGGDPRGATGSASAGADPTAPNGLGNQADLRGELERARIALADLAAARSGRRANSRDEVVQLDRLVWRAATASDVAARRVGGGVHLDWSAGAVAVRADRGRLAQALSNLLANAVEHGGGHVRVIGRRTKRGVRIEVRDSGRGHGLAIAAKAVRESGGSLTAARAGIGTSVAIDLPIAADGRTRHEGPTDLQAGDIPAAHLRAGRPPLASSDPTAAA